MTANTYDEYGILGASNTTRFGYTGQVDLSELGLLYYKARMYDPKIGRFLQTDPIGYDDGMNWYAYVGGDPINMVDPYGLEDCPPNDPDCVVVTGPRRSCTAICLENLPAINITDASWLNDILDVGKVVVVWGKRKSKNNDNVCKAGKLNLFNPNDKHMPKSSAESALSPDGSFLVEGHGSVNGGMYGSDGNPIAASNLANMISTNPNYRGGNVFLGGCNVGRNREYLQTVANSLNVCVSAYNVQALYHANGGKITARGADFRHPIRDFKSISYGVTNGFKTTKCPQ